MAERKGFLPSVSGNEWKEGIHDSGRASSHLPFP